MPGTDLSQTLRDIQDAYHEMLDEAADDHEREEVILAVTDLIREHVSEMHGALRKEEADRKFKEATDRMVADYQSQADAHARWREEFKAAGQLP